MIDQNLRNKFISQHPQNSDIIKPWLIGKNVNPWNIEKEGFYLIAIQNSGDKDCTHPWKDAKTEQDARIIFKEKYSRYS